MHREGKRGVNICKGRMIIPFAKMVYVAAVERGNRLFVLLESFESEK